MQLIYFSVYRYLSKVKTNTDPAFTAILLLCLLQCINVVSMIVIINRSLFGVKTYFHQSATVFVVVLFTLILFFDITGLYLKTHEIRSKFERASVGRVRCGMVMFLIYGLISFIVAYFASPTGYTRLH